MWSLLAVDVVGDVGRRRRRWRSTSAATSADVGGAGLRVLAVDVRETRKQNNTSRLEDQSK